MAFEHRLTPYAVAMAEAVALERESRQKDVGRHRPASHEDAEIAGATAEVAWAEAYQFPLTRVSADGDDPGWDFCHGVWTTRNRCRGTTVDVKASSVHPESWVVKAGKLKMDWLVFAWVELPDLVVFKAKAPAAWIEPKGLVEKVGNKRLVNRSEVQEIERGDFS